jgi:hypothetical protein
LPKPSSSGSGNQANSEPGNGAVVVVSSPLSWPEIEMRIVATVFFAFAGIVGLTSALALLTFWYRFSGWPDDPPKYEAFMGALMFAASMALIGAVLKSWNQRTISNRQVAAERRRQEQALRPKKQQIASEFIGETDVIVLHYQSLRSAIENAIRTLEARTGKVAIEGVHVLKHGRHFDHSPAEFRLLPRTISKELTRFYAIVRETESDLEWYSRAIEAYANQRIRLMNPGQMIRLLRKILGNMDSSSRMSRTLIEELMEIRDTDCD